VAGTAVPSVTAAPVSAARRSAAASTDGSGPNPLGAAIVTSMPAVTPPSISECAMLLAPSPKYDILKPRSDPTRSATVCRSAST